jgi:tripartite-type tricarboxylate transporter receptor subunit TctC
MTYQFPFGRAAAPLAVALGLAFAGSAGSASAQQIDQSLEMLWQGQTVKVIVGASAGGTGDTWVRMMLRYMQPLLPGHPNFVVTNESGADGAIAANEVYRAKGDGLTLLGDSPPALTAVMGGGAEQGIMFDLDKLNWIGSASVNGGVLMATKESGLTPENVGTRPFTVSEQVVGDTISVIGMAANDALGWQQEMKFGYDGSGERILGMRRGEVDATWASWANWEELGEELAAGAFVPIATYGSVPDDPFLEGVPAIEDLAEKAGPDAAALVNLVTLYTRWGRPILAPPNMEPNVLGTLRAALSQAVAEPEFIKEAESLGLIVSPVSGEDIQKIVAEMVATPQPVKDRLQALIKQEQERE